MARLPLGRRGILARGGLAAAIFFGMLGSLGDTVVEGQLAHDLPIAPLEGGRQVAQSFPVAADGLESIELLMANYGQPSTGELEVLLVAPSRGEAEAAPPLHRWLIEAATVEDNQWRRFALPEPLEAPAGRASPRGERLTLLLRRETMGSPLTVWASQGEVWPAGQLHVDGARQAGDLAIRLHYRSGRWGAIRHAFGRAGLPMPAGITILIGLALATSWIAAAGLASLRITELTKASRAGRGDAAER